jgi:hypothetical protein
MNRFFSLSISGLILILGCGKPTDPESLKPNDGGYKIVARIATTGFANDVLKKDSLIYIAQGEGGLLIYNVSDPINPSLVSLTTEGLRGYAGKIIIYDSTVYLAANTFGINVVDVRDPDTPVVTITNLGIKPARSFTVLGNFLLTAISEQGVGIADVSYPTEPDIRGQFPTTGYAYGLVTSADSNYLFVAGGEMGLSIYDISDFQDGFGIYPQVGWCDTPGDAEAIVIDESKSVAYLACGTAGLQIISYADSANFFIAGSFDSVGYAKDLQLSGDRIFLSAELGGLQIIDISDFTTPKLVGAVETKFALGLDMDEDFIYLADEDEGVIVISKPLIGIQ